VCTGETATDKENHHRPQRATVAVARAALGTLAAGEESESGTGDEDDSRRGTDSYVKASTFMRPLTAFASMLDLPASVVHACARSEKTRMTQDTSTLDERSARNLTRGVAAVVEGILRLCVPNDTAGVFSAIRKRLDGALGADGSAKRGAAQQQQYADMVDAAAQVLYALPRRSRERKAVLAVVSAGGKAAAENVLLKASCYGPGAVDDGSSCGDDSGAENDDGAGVEETKGDGDCGDVDGEDNDDHRRTAKKPRGQQATLTKWAFNRARCDFITMVDGNTLERDKANRKRRSDAAVTGAVAFAFRADMASVLSWGTKTVLVKGNREVIEARNRIQSRERMWAVYDAEQTAAGVPRVDRLQRRAFLQVVGKITAPDLKVRSATNMRTRV
jgi:hypothetical protein